MKDIVEIDKNFAIETKIVRDGLTFFDPQQAPFRIYGVFKENGKFRRMPEAVAKSVSAGVYSLHTHTAGGRVRFITDSPYVAIKAKGMPSRMDHFALTGCGGYDMYMDEGTEEGIRYAGTFRMPYHMEDEFENVLDFPEKRERVITINLPLYGEVEHFWIGLQDGCCLKEAPEYKITKPVVYYGSSITQGGCASKPGSSYQSILERKFDCDYINLGFSGNAKAEDEMIEYIKGLDMSVFVYDYDHNAPTIEHLQATHNKMFMAIREAHPDLPILILPRPKYYLTPGEEERAKIVKDTYLAAKARGDEHVYHITGKKLMELVRDNGTVDNCHPTDSGFFSMALAIGEVFEKILLP